MKVVKRVLLVFVLLLVAGIVYVAYHAFPIISGYGAKNLCSCTFLAGRETEDIISNELGFFPVKLGSFSVDMNDSSATGSVFGLARRKAVYRRGTGCSLVVGVDEETFRAEKLPVVEPATFDPDTVAWPMGDQLPDSIPAAIDQQKLNDALDYVFAEGAEGKRRTRAILVLYNGQIVAERYAKGFHKNSILTGWSMAKSVTNALTGILVKDGKLDVAAPAPVDAWKNDARHQITLTNLLHANSGLEWEENYSVPSPATRMLYTQKDMGLYAAAFPAAKSPGEAFYYSSGTTNIISRIIRDQVGEEEYLSFPYKRLFHRIGMRHATFETDAGGTFVGSSYCFASPRDWARFGLLYLQDGVWNGERILPEGWVKFTATPATGAKRGEYGAQFWLNAGAPGNASDRFFPDVPADLFWADGYEGQNVFIIPSRKLVLVKLSLSQGDYVDDNEFLKRVLAALPE